SLKHPNILQCLGQCSENIPFLLVMEFCQLGDLKRYLRAQRKSDGMTPELPTRDLLTLQRMAFEITSGLLHLHENNYIHSDLALRNCLLTSDLTVRIGDYGLSHNHYKEDYYLTPDKLWIPLRWIAPELLEEYRGSLIVTDQTKTSNVWSLGVVIWELFEFGAQPHRHLSDEEVLTFVIRERQITLAQPRLKLSHADYWYEIMQSCWLPPSQRPSVAEIFLLLSSLLAAERGMSKRGEDEEDEEYEEGRGRRGESDESFERRWDLLRPPAFQSAANERNREYGRDGRDNSYPLLDPVGNCITPSSSELDDILTVTETSKGLNFEYFWEKAHARRGYKPLPPPQPIPTVNNNHRQSLDTPTVVPVISARSPSLASEYYIRLEEHTPQDKSPTLKGKSQSSLQSDSVSPGDVELVEIHSGILGKERVPYRASENSGKMLQTIRSSEVKIQMPNTGMAEFRDTSSRVTDFSVVDLGDDDDVERKKGREADKKSPTTFQAPVLPPKPRSMSMSSSNHLHSRPLPVPPLGYRGLPHYTISGKIETDPLHMSSCPPSTFDHLGLHRSRQTLPPSPSLSPSIPPSSHPIYPQMCPPPLPPHFKLQRSIPRHNTADRFSRYTKTQMQRSNRDPLSCDISDRESDRRHAASIYTSKEDSHPHVKDFDSPIRRENPLRPIYRNPPRTNSQIERQSSSSPTYSDEDDSPFASPERPNRTTVAHSSLSEDADPATSELFSRGMKRTQSRLDTILPTIWREDAELQAERLAAAKKSPMHLFLTEISSATDSTEAKSEPLWDGEKEESKDGERWGSFVLHNKGMRRSQSLITEIGSAGQSLGQEKYLQRAGIEEDKASFQGDLFLTEVDTDRMDPNMDAESDPVKYLYPAGSRLRPYVCSPDLTSNREAEDGSTKGIRRSRSLLSERGKQHSEIHLCGTEPRKAEMTREEFLKEIQSAETFLTEIISRQNAAANKDESDPSVSPTPLSPEYESICIDPNSTQTITFQSASSIRASNKGKEETQTEAIYAQVTKRAKKSEIKVSIRPEIPILHIGSNKQLFEPCNQENNADHCQTGEFVLSEIMPKNGLLHNESDECQKEEEDCSDGPALPSRGELTDPSEFSPFESTESNTVILRENKSLITNKTATVVENGEMMKDNLKDRGSRIEDQTEGKSGAASGNIENAADLEGNGDNFFQHKCNDQEKNIMKNEPSHEVTPNFPDHDLSSDISLMTPTDSVLSPMTSSSADGLTPSDSWTGVGGSGGWRALGNETPHRDSAYFSDNDLEGDGMNRRSIDGPGSRQSSGRGGEWGILTGIEEKTEEEGEAGEKSPLRSTLQSSCSKTEIGDEKTIENCETDFYYFDSDKDILNKGLEAVHKDDSGIFPNCNESKRSTLLHDDQVKDCVDLIDKLFSKLDEEPLKTLSHSGGYVIDSHYTDGIISKISDYKCTESEQSNLNLHSKSPSGTKSLINSMSGIDRPDLTGRGLTALRSLKFENTTVESESRLSKQSEFQSNDDMHSEDKFNLTGRCTEQGVEDMSSLDDNELGMTNLHCSDQRADMEVRMELDTHQAFADSCEGPDVMTEDWWRTVEEDEEAPPSGGINGEFNCHRSTESGDQNNQWASPEKSQQEVELRSECFAGFSNNNWGVQEKYWDPEENDEHAGREPHPSSTEGTNETQELKCNLIVCETIKDTERSINQQSAADVQQEENIENLEEIDSFKSDVMKKICDTEVENIETPEEERFVERQIQDRGWLTDTEENQNFNRLTQNQLSREGQTSIQHINSENHFSHSFQNKTSSISISITEPPQGNCSDLENDESSFKQEAEQRPCLAIQSIEESLQKAKEDYRDVPLQSDLSNSDVQEEMNHSYQEVDNFSSVDFPSPPPSIDLDVQDDKLESLDDSFPSPPPSVTEAEEFITHINLEDFGCVPETESYISPANHTDVLEPTLQELPPATTQNKGISANLNSPSVQITLTDDNNFTSDIEDVYHNFTQKTSPAGPSTQRDLLKNIPALLISEWKDLDEEPLEDFEKLEQLCCISGDEEETLGELFLENLELLESLKKTADQKDSDTEAGDDFFTPEGNKWDFKAGEVSDNCNKLVEPEQKILSQPAEKIDEQRSSGHTSDVKDQGSLSKMTTRNGLMMQVCEERLQFSLSENVKTNMLWGSAVKETVTLRPWGEQVKESCRGPVEDQKEDESQEEKEADFSQQPLIESDKTEPEPLTVIEQPEITASQPAANQAMKAKLARLSLALPPLALNLPLAPSGKGGFGDGPIGNRIGRRRGLSSGIDPDDEEEDEQEDENSRRVIVVTETDVDKRIGLRSLLKSPKEPLDREQDRGRNVSFFDDVTIYLFDQETPTNELSNSAPTSPGSVSVKNSKLDFHGPNKSKESKRKEDLSIKLRSPVIGGPVTSSRFTVSPANDPHLV
ncbi:hypothetical protein XENORESO_000221, partial [Xenotaenia resolanae]